GPFDPTADASTNRSSYVANLRCFAQDGIPAGKRMRYPHDFSDGTSQTIFFVEGYSNPYFRPPSTLQVPRTFGHSSGYFISQPYHTSGFQIAPKKRDADSE